jgi:hypothetical protein
MFNLDCFNDQHTNEQCVKISNIQVCNWNSLLFYLPVKIAEKCFKPYNKLKLLRYLRKRIGEQITDIEILDTDTSTKIPETTCNIVVDLDRAYFLDTMNKQIKDQFLDKFYGIYWYCSDDEFVRSAIKKDEKFILYAEDIICDRYRIMKYLIKRYPYMIQYIGNGLRNNYKFMKYAIRICPSSLEFASNELRNNIKLVTYATSLQFDVFEFASDSLKDNYDFMKSEISKNSRALK